MDGNNVGSDTVAMDGNYLAGGWYLGVGILGLIGYVPVLFVIIRTKEMISKPFYKFLVSLGISDSIGLLAWLLQSVHILRGGDFLGKTFQHVVVSVVVLTYHKLVLDLALIAFNRYSCVMRPKWRIRFFSQSWGVWVWIGTSVGIGALVSVPSVFCADDYIDLHYYVAVVSFGTKTAKITSFSMVLIRNTFVFIISLTSYSFIFKEARTNAKRVASHVQGGNKNENTPKFNRKHAKLAIQSAFICLFFYYETIIFYFYEIAGWPQNRWVSFFTSSIFWELNFAVNPWIYLIFNSALQKEFRKMVCGGKKKKQNDPNPHRIDVQLQ